MDVYHTYIGAVEGLLRWSSKQIRQAVSLRTREEKEKKRNSPSPFSSSGREGPSETSKDKKEKKGRYLKHTVKARHSSSTGAALLEAVAKKTPPAGLLLRVSLAQRRGRMMDTKATLEVT